MLAEDLLLLLTDDATGKLLLPAEQVDIALGGANLLELTLLERVSLDEGKHVVVFDPSSTGDPTLDGALGVIGTRQGRKPKAVVEPLGENLRTTLYIRLVAEGVLRAQERKVLGILPFTAGRPREPSTRSACARSLRRCWFKGPRRAPGLRRSSRCCMP